MYVSHTKRPSLMVHTHTDKTANVFFKKAWHWLTVLAGKEGYQVLRFDAQEIRFLAGSIMDIVLKTVLRCLGCGLRVIVMLEGKPLARSGLLSTLNTSFWKVNCFICSIQPFLCLSSTLAIFPFQKKPHQKQRSVCIIKRPHQHTMCIDIG